MRSHKFHIVGLFIIVSLFLSCEGSVYKEQVSKYPEIKVAQNWALRLPFELREILLKDNFYQQNFASSNSSIIVGVSTDTATIEEALNQFKYIVENEKQGKVSGPCMGDSKGYYKNYNFIDSVNMQSGIITDYEESGCWEVQFDVVSAKTGERLSLGFDKLTYQDIKLIHEAIRSIRHY